MNNNIKKIKNPHFIIKFLSFIIVLFLLDFSVGGILKHFYFKQKSGLLSRTTFAMDSTHADILILGSSTANHHYVSDLFENELHLSCYNTGRDGNSLLYSYAVFRSVLTRCTPKMIILDIYDHEFQKDQDNYDRLSSLLPYYYDHSEIHSIIQLRSPFEKYKLISKIYPYNSLIFTIGIGNTDLNNGRAETSDQKGYVPAVNTSNSKVSLKTDTSYSRYKMDSTLINTFQSFVKDCRSLNIPLYVFVSPKFKKFEHEDSTIGVAKKITGEFNVPFYSFANDSFFLSHKELYSDNIHLNDEGARIFTGLVIKKIQKKE